MNKNSAILLFLAAIGFGIALDRQRRNARAVCWNQKMPGAPGRLALVTGASSGIGAVYARRLAQLGYNLILVARREERLFELSQELESHWGIKAEVLAADLSTKEGIARVEKRIHAAAGDGGIDFLVNNAGYGILAPFEEIPIEKTIGLIHCLEIACVRLIHAALPSMLAHRRGAIVNVSSIAGFIAKPFDATYDAAKAYLTIFSESLAMEVSGKGVQVQALCPGLTMTEFHDSVQYAQYQIKERFPRWVTMTPEQVVEASLRALAESDRCLCVPGWQNKLVVAAARAGLTTFAFNFARKYLPGLAVGLTTLGDRL